MTVLGLNAFILRRRHSPCFLLHLICNLTTYSEWCWGPQALGSSVGSGQALAPLPHPGQG